MSFLSPWPAVWAAAVAIPLLVLLYMLRLRRRAVRVSSTLLWEEAVKDLHANEPLRKFRASWLFLLQFLALVAVLLAIARPVVPGTSLTSDRIVIVLDRSASMRATDVAPGPSNDAATPPRSRFDEAKASALALIDELGRSTGPRGGRPEAMIVGAAATAEALTDFTSNLSDLRDAISAMEPSDQPLNEGRIAELLRSVPPPETDPDEASAGAGTWGVSAVLITDGWLDGRELARIPAEIALSIRPVLPLGARPGSPTGSAPTSDILADNIGIVGLSARRSAQDPLNVRVFARIVNGGPNDLQVPIVCLTDGSPRESMTVRVPGMSSGTAAAFDAADGAAPARSAPGQTTATFDVQAPGRTLITVTIARPDVLEADNRASVVIEPLRRPRVLVVAPTHADSSDSATPAGTAEPFADPFLLSALEAAEVASLRVVDPGVMERWSREAPAELVSGFDLIVLDRTSPTAGVRVPTLSFRDPIRVLNSNEIGSGQRRRADGDAASNLSALGRSRFATWDRAHPVMRDVGLAEVVVVTTASQPVVPRPDPMGERRLSTIAFGGVEGAAGTFPLIDAWEDGSAAEGPPRAVEVAFDLDRSNWGPSESFPIFVINAIEWLTGGDDARWGLGGRSATTSAPLLLGPGMPPLALLAGRPGNSASPARVRLAGPSGTVESPVTALGRAALAPPTRAGLHTLSLVDAEGSTIAGSEAMWPVNLHSIEESAAGARLAQPWVGQSFEVASARTDARTPSAPIGSDFDALRRAGREVWHWFAIAALVLLSLEWVIFAWRSRA